MSGDRPINCPWCNKDVTAIESLSCDSRTLIEHVVQRLLSFIGEDVLREGIKSTPERVARMYEEIFQGYDESRKPKVTTFPNKKDSTDYNQMAIDSGRFYSMCEHHMMPFFGEYYFAYIPKAKIIGLSKVSRVVKYFSSKLQIQERLGKEVVDYISQEAECSNIALVLVGRHLCKEMRGVRNTGLMVTSELRGAFREDPKTRQEFMMFVNGGLLNGKSLG